MSLKDVMGIGGVQLIIVVRNMSTLHKEYHKTNIANTEIKFSISYKKCSAFATSGWAKGYYVNAVPVKISRSGNITMEEFGAFTGFNDILLQVERPSPKRYQQALAVFEVNKEKYFKWFEDQQQLIVEKI